MSRNRRLTNLEKKHQTMPVDLSLEQFSSLSLEQMAQYYHEMVNAPIPSVKPYGADITPEEAERRYRELMR